MINILYFLSIVTQKLTSSFVGGVLCFSGFLYVSLGRRLAVKLKETSKQNTAVRNKMQRCEKRSDTVGNVSSFDGPLGYWNDSCEVINKDDCVLLYYLAVVVKVETRALQSSQSEVEQAE